MKKILVILGLALLMTGATALVGDINNDCKTDLIDLALMGQAWQTTPRDELWNPDADLDGSGMVNLKDLGILGRHYKQTC